MGDDNVSGNNVNENTTSKRPRGFAAISPEQRKAISSAGGKAAHVKGTAHEFTSDEARVAGRLGGKKTAAIKRARAAKPND